MMERLLSPDKRCSRSVRVIDGYIRAGEDGLPPQLKLYATPPIPLPPKLQLADTICNPNNHSHGFLCIGEP